MSLMRILADYLLVKTPTKAKCECLKGIKASWKLEADKKGTSYAILNLRQRKGVSHLADNFLFIETSRSFFGRLEGTVGSGKFFTKTLNFQFFHIFHKNLIRSPRR
jgi:hypothetical protein